MPFLPGNPINPYNPVCQRCGKPLESQKKGRPRRYCSDRCRRGLKPSRKLSQRDRDQIRALREANTSEEIARAYEVSPVTVRRIRTT